MPREPPADRANSSSHTMCRSWSAHAGWRGSSWPLVWPGRIDLTQLKLQHLEELIEHLDDLTVDLDDPDSKVQVFCE